jgi:hypothetical protein
MALSSYVALLVTATGVTVASTGGAAHSGPCTAQIEQLERQIQLAAPSLGSGPTAPQSIGAQLHHQPTPAAVQDAQNRANAAAEAALQSARRADADGNAAACATTIEVAKHHWVIGLS